MKTKTWMIYYEGKMEIGVPEGEDPESAALAYIPDGAEITDTVEQTQEFDEMEDR